MGWLPHGRNTVGVGVCLLRHTPKGMLDRSLKEEQVLRMDERLTRVVRIIVEQYDGDVKAFVESIRYRVEVNRKAQAALDHGDEAVWRHV